MIGFMPELYPDELVYSWLSRYHAKSGHATHRQTIEELLYNPRDRIEIEFINHFTDDFQNVLLKHIPIEQLIAEHTMFQSYAIFLPYEERREVFNSLVKMNGKYRQIHGMHSSGNLNNLRYCPLCVKEDREHYGETYWHRQWQIYGVDVCPKHKCYLENTDIICNGRSRLASMFITAEESISTNIDKTKTAEDELEIELSQYAINVFNTDINMNNSITAGEYLHSTMEGTKYLAPRGEVRKLELIYSDLKKYYGTLLKNTYTRKAQLQEVFSNLRYQFIDICILGMFLKSAPDKLVNRSLPQKTQQQIFDEKVLELRNKGLKFCEIAEQLNASDGVVKTSYHNTYKKREVSKPVKKENMYDWGKLDAEYLPTVKKVIAEMWEDQENFQCPRRVTIFGVEQKMGFYQKKFNKLPLCKAEIEKYQESYPEYWARKVVWAEKRVRSSSNNLNITNISKLTSIKKPQLLQCVDFIDKYTCKEIAEEIRIIIEKS